MPHYTYTVMGRDGNGRLYSTTGKVSAESEGQFPLIVNDALQDSFMQLTQGKAVYGSPGVGCTGPYTTLMLVVAREDE